MHRVRELDDPAVVAEANAVWEEMLRSRLGMPDVWGPCEPDVFWGESKDEEGWAYTLRQHVPAAYPLKLVDLLHLDGITPVMRVEWPSLQLRFRPPRVLELDDGPRSSLPTGMALCGLAGVILALAVAWLPRRGRARIEGGRSS